MHQENKQTKGTFLVYLHCIQVGHVTKFSHFVILGFSTTEPKLSNHLLQFSDLMSWKMSVHSYT